MSEAPLYVPSSLDSGPAKRVKFVSRAYRAQLQSVERKENSFNILEDVCTENSSSQGQNLALNGVLVPSYFSAERYAALKASVGVQWPFPLSRATQPVILCGER